MAIEKTKLVKNTGLLYVRMFVLMAVSLYTSRVVLSALGITDYGIYNVVGGFVTMIGFLKGTMSTTSSRFITVALGRNVLYEMRKNFTCILLVNFFLAILIVLLAETVGLWFLVEKMTIPVGREEAAFWVYQLSVISVSMNIITVPYNATIIAHERMGAFAYISLFDAFAKLGIVFLITHSSNDRLVYYSFLMLLINVLNVFLYFFYCLKHFEESRFKFVFDIKIIKEVFGFITWASYGSFASVGFTHGLNIILNIYFGPVVNAARGIAVQVQHAIVHFVTNFQTALNPQLMKSTAREDFGDARMLLIASSKFSFFLLCLLGIPMIIQAPIVLSFWLKDVPDNSVGFCRIILIISIWGALANPLRVINQAEGNIRKFQIYECTLLLLIMPLSYFILNIWQIPILVFIVHLIIELCAQFVRIYIVIPKIKMSFGDYYGYILKKIIPFFLISFLVGLLFNMIHISNQFLCFFTNLFVEEVVMLILIYSMGLSTYEKCYIKNILFSHILKKK